MALRQEFTCSCLGGKQWIADCGTSAVRFGFAAVWIMWSLPAALICLLSAAAGYGAVVVAERVRAKLAARANTRPASSNPGALSQQADELNRDLGHIYEPPHTGTSERPSPEGDAPIE